MRFEEHDDLRAEIGCLAHSPLPISLAHWNRFLDALESALRAEYVRGVEAAPALAARAAIDDEEPQP